MSLASERLAGLLEGVIQHLTEAVTVIAESGEYVFANQLAADMCGYASVTEFLEAGAAATFARFELLDEFGNPLSAESLPGRRALAGDGPTQVATVRYRDQATGEVRWTRVTSSAFADPVTGGRYVVNLFRDATEEIRANRATTFLMEATRVLESSLDYDSTLRHLAELSVPTLADWCGIDIVESDGEVRQLAVAHVDPAKVDLARRLRERLPYDPDGEHGSALVLRTGESELIEAVPREVITEAGLPPDVVQIVLDLGLHSSICVPLTARGRTIGALSLISAESRRSFTQDDLVLAQELASRAAMSVDNARLHREVLESTARLEAVLGQMADGVVIAGADGTITFANDASRELFGEVPMGGPWQAGPASTIDLEGQPLPASSLPLNRALHGERLTGERFSVIRSDGSRVDIESYSVPVRGPDGSIVGAVAVDRNITDKQEFERQKELFLLSASHDLKNPLTLLKGLAQLLEQRAARVENPDRDLLRGLSRIDATATRMTHLVNELLDVTRLQMQGGLPLELQRVDLVKLVRRAVDEAQASTDRHTIEFETDTEVLQGEWDGPRIERVAFNLLSNAVKFSPDGGRIQVRVSGETGDHGSYGVLFVKDEGLGISDDDKPFIFETFKRGDNVEGRIGGSGIGLAGVKQIVEQHGGDVDVISRQGAGTTFIVRLPERVPEKEGE